MPIGKTKNTASFFDESLVCLLFIIVVNMLLLCGRKKGKMWLIALGLALTPILEGSNPTPCSFIDSRKELD